MLKSYQSTPFMSTHYSNGKRKPTPKKSPVSIQYEFDYLPTADDLAELLHDLRFLGGVK